MIYYKESEEMGGRLIEYDPDAISWRLSKKMLFSYNPLYYQLPNWQGARKFCDATMDPEVPQPSFAKCLNLWG